MSSTTKPLREVVQHLADYLSGTHKGEFVGLQPTDRQFNVNGMTVFAFRDSKVVERWNLLDMMSLREQLSS